MKIGYVGLGQMGSAIARNLLRAGHEVTVYNRTREKAQALEKDGARIANSPADAAAGSEVVGSMLADDETVAALAFGEDGIVAGLARDAVHVSQGTISLALARRLAAEHEQRQQAYLSAPVFGRPDVAEAGKLIVVVAGEEEGARRCQPLFDAIGGRRSTWAASPGRPTWSSSAAILCSPAWWKCSARRSPLPARRASTITGFWK